MSVLGRSRPSAEGSIPIDGPVRRRPRPASCRNLFAERPVPLRKGFDGLALGSTDPRSAFAGTGPDPKRSFAAVAVTAEIGGPSALAYTRCVTGFHPPGNSH